MKTFDRLDIYLSRLKRFWLLLLLLFPTFWLGWVLQSFQSTDRGIVIKYGLGRLTYFLLTSAEQFLDWMSPRSHAPIPWDKWPISRDVISFLRHYYPYLDERMLDASFWVAAAALFAAILGVWLLNAVLGPGAANSTGTLARGAEIIDWRHLAHQTAIPAWKIWRWADRSHQLKIGQVPIPFRFENRHILLGGSTGTGKSQTLYQIAEQLLGRFDRALILDLGGALLSRFGHKGSGILNDLDDRSLHWNPFLDIQEAGDLQSLVQAAIPEATGETEEWRSYARTLMMAVLSKLAGTEEAKPSRVVYYATHAGTKELAALCAGTKAQRFFEKGNEKMLSNSLTNFAKAVEAWEELHDGGTFSMRKWIREGQGWLFVNVSDKQFELMRPLVSIWMWLAITESLGLPENDSRRFWFLMDELASYNQLPKLSEALSKLRKYGGCVVAAVQDVAQLDVLYGHDHARTVRNCFSTFLALRCEDPETAEYAARRVGGAQEIEREQLSTTANLQSTSQTRSINIEPNQAVLASEIGRLPDCIGYLKIAGGYDAAKVEIPVSSVKPRIEAFVPKKKAKGSPAS